MIVVLALLCSACGLPPKGARRIVRLAASKSGKWLAAGTGSGKIAVWNTGTNEKPLQARDPGGVINDLQFSPDEQWLAIAGRNLTLRRLDNFATAKTLPADDRNYGSSQFSADGQAILTIDGRGTIQILDSQSGKTIVSVCCSTIGGDVAFTPGGERFLCSGHMPRIWDARSGELVLQLSRDREFMLLGPIAFQRDQVLMGSQDGSIHVWNWRTGERLPASPQSADWVETIAIRDRPESIAYAARNTALRVWDQGNKTRISLPAIRSTSNMVFAAEDGPLAIGLFDGGVQFWQLERPKLLRVFAFPQ